MTAVVINKYLHKQVAIENMHIKGWLFEDLRNKNLIFTIQQATKNTDLNQLLLTGDIAACVCTLNLDIDNYSADDNFGVYTNICILENGASCYLIVDAQTNNLLATISNCRIA